MTPYDCARFDWDAVRSLVHPSADRGPVRVSTGSLTHLPVKPSGPARVRACLQLVAGSWAGVGDSGDSRPDSAPDASTGASSGAGAGAGAGAEPADRAETDAASPPTRGAPSVRPGSRRRSRSRSPRPGADSLTDGTGG